MRPCGLHESSSRESSRPSGYVSPCPGALASPIPAQSNQDRSTPPMCPRTRTCAAACGPRPPLAGTLSRRGRCAPPPWRRGPAADRLAASAVLPDTLGRRMRPDPADLRCLAALPIPGWSWLRRRWRLVRHRAPRPAAPFGRARQSWPTLWPEPCAFPPPPPHSRSRSISYSDVANPVTRTVSSARGHHQIVF